MCVDAMRTPSGLPRRRPTQFGRVSARARSPATTYAWAPLHAFTQRLMREGYCMQALTQVMS